jgi:hypothetical protein
MASVLFLLLTTATATLVSIRFLRPLNRLAFTIGLIVIWLCTVILPVQLLAALQLWRFTSSLHLPQLFLCHAIALACALALALPRWRSNSHLNGIAPPTQPRAPLPWHLLAGLLIVLCVYAITFASIPFRFPGDLTAVVYHYPVALRWLQEGTLRINASTNWRAGLPGNLEILDLLILATGKDRFLGIMQLPGTVILVLACLQLGRRLLQSQVSVWPIAMTALMIPMVVQQSISGYVDVFGTALLFGSLTLILEYRDQLRQNAPVKNPGLLVVAGLACGIANGSKPVFWAYSIVLLLNATFALAGGRRGLDRHLLWRSALILGGVLLPSVFWFARAAEGTGNPFYPFAITIGSFSLPGVRSTDITSPHSYLASVRHWSEWFVYPWIEWKRHTGYFLQSYTVDSGLGGGFATFVAPGVFYTFWLALNRRPDLRVWLFNLVAIALLWWFPLQQLTRFGLPVLVLASIACTPFFEILELQASRLYRSIYVLTFAITACILLLDPLYTIAQTIRAQDFSRAKFYEYPKIIDALPPGSRIVNLYEDTLNFALAGSHLSNVVIPTWDVPETLTPAFLIAHQVDFVVQGVSSQSAARASVPPVARLELYYSERVPYGSGFAEWTIWSTRALPRSATPTANCFRPRLAFASLNACGSTPSPRP